MQRELGFRPMTAAIARELDEQVQASNTADAGAPPPKFLYADIAAPAIAAPAEKELAAEKAAAVVENADQLESNIHKIIDGLKQRAEQIERQGLAILAELSERRATFQKNADSFLETTAKWQSGLRDVFAASIEKKDAA